MEDLYVKNLEQRLNSISRYRFTYNKDWKGGEIGKLGDVLLGVVDNSCITNVRYIFKNVELTSSKVKTGELFYWRPTITPIPMYLLHKENLKIYVTSSDENIPISLEYYVFNNKDILTQNKNISGMLLSTVKVDFLNQKPSGYKNINTSQYKGSYMWKIDNHNLFVLSI